MTPTLQRPTDDDRQHSPIYAQQMDRWLAEHKSPPGNTDHDILLHEMRTPTPVMNDARDHGIAPWTEERRAAFEPVLAQYRKDEAAAAKPPRPRAPRKPRARKARS